MNYCIFLILTIGCCWQQGLTQQWNHLENGLPGYLWTVEFHGNDLYAGGEFLNAGDDEDADYLARWDGCEWHPVAAGLDGAVSAIAFDGDDILVGGIFTQPYFYIARWDGTQWSSLGNALPDPVSCIVVQGSDIYVTGGNFNSSFVKKLNGGVWENLGQTLNAGVSDMIFHAGALYIAGGFTNADGNPDADRIAKWNGSSWENLGTGISGGGFVSDLLSHGNDLFVGGTYIDAGGNASADHVCKWDGNAWINLGSGPQYFLGFYMICLYNGDLCTTVGAGWSGFNGISRFNEAAGVWEEWQEMELGADDPLTVLAGDDENLYTGGYSFGVSGEYFYAIGRYGPPGTTIIISGVPEEICSTASPIALPVEQSGFTGTWSGAGVDNNMFDPEGLNGFITLTYTPDPGQCVSPAEFYIEVQSCNGTPPCPEGQDSTYEICPVYWSGGVGYTEMLLDLGLPLNGSWDPPLTCSNSNSMYNYCNDSAAVYIYPHQYPDCPLVFDTAHFFSEWDPCGWNVEDLCWSGDTLHFTIPPSPDPFGNTTYDLHVGFDNLYSTIFEDLSLNASFTSYITEGIGEVFFAAALEGNPECYFYISLTNCFGWISAPFCECIEPPYAGEDNSTTICSDTIPFDLTELINGNPDPGGTWSPPFASGNNIYDPAVDGAGTFTYTVTAPNCPPDMANVTVNIVDLSTSNATVSCSDNGTPADETDDLILIAFTPAGYHAGGNYSVSISSGTIIPGSGNYNSTTIFQLQPGSAGNGNVILTVTDNASPFCSFDFVITDPGSCSGCPPGMSFTETICPYWEATNNFPGTANYPQNGIWEPPLQTWNGTAYYSCVDSASVYIYPHDYPGCATVYDTVAFDMIFNPCGWQPIDICYSPDSIYFTMPPFTGDAGGAQTYMLIASGELPSGYYNINQVFHFDSTYTIAVPVPSWYDPGSGNGCFSIGLLVNGCWWNFGELILFDFTCVAVNTACDCADPPHAGTDNNMTVCGDEVQIDLFTLMNNPDPGGTWSPPLASGGSIYHSGLDGQGTFTYTVSSPLCPDDVANVVMTVVDLDESIVTVSCDDHDTPTDTTDDIIIIAFTPVGNTAGTVYTASVSQGTITPATGVFNNTTIFEMQPGSAGNGNVILTITDGASPFCSFTFDVIDPGPCSNSVSCPGGSDTTIFICPLWNNVDIFFAASGLPQGGTFEPPLQTPLIYYSCADSNSVYVYAQDYAGCPTIFDTVNIDLLWDPCGWQPDPICYTDSTITFTLSSWPGSGATEYILQVPGESGLVFYPDTFQFNETETITIPLPSWYDSVGLINYEMSVFQVDGSMCSWYFGEMLAFDFFYILNIPPCGCAQVPFAGEDVSVALCEQDSPVDLFALLGGGADPTGDWSPSLTSGGNIFDPEVDAPGDYLYIVFFPDCPADTALVSVSIEPAQPVNISGVPAALCENASPILLPAIQNGIVGNWSGPGIFNNLFDPENLSGLIDLAFIPDPGQCAVASDTSIMLVSEQTLSFPGLLDTVCYNTDSVFLSPVQQGIAGQWSGNGVSGDYFHPMPVNDTVMLLFTPDSNQCATVASAAIEVHVAPAFQNLVAACDTMSAAYMVSFDMTGSKPGTYMVDGNIVAGGSFVSMPIDADSIHYSFFLDDLYGCGPTEVSGTKNCACLTDAGTMDFSIAPVSICLTGSATVQHNNDAVLDVMDSLVYVLHDNSGASLGTIYGVFGGPIIAGSDSIIIGTQYYVSAVVGASTGVGGIDWQDPCLAVSPGIPVQFYLPSVNFSASEAICPNECHTYTVSFTGMPPFTATLDVIANTIPTHYTIHADGEVAYFTICPDNYGFTGGILQIQLLTLADSNCTMQLQADPIELFVQPAAISQVALTLCRDEQIIIDNMVFDTANPTGIVLLPGAAVSGCDSLVEVALSFYQPSVALVNDTLCDGSSLIIQGTVFDELNPTGNVTIPGGSVHGCDSLVRVELSFRDVPTGTFSDTLCSGSSLSIEGTLFDEFNPVGEVWIDNGSIHGCDSMVHVQLHFDSVLITSLTHIVCPEDSVSAGDTLYLTSVQGCDSIVYLTVSFYPPAVGFLTDTLAAKDSIVINGTVYHDGNPAGSEILDGQSAEGCDSILHIQLYFHSNILQAIVSGSDPFCYGDSSGMIQIEAVSGATGPFIMVVNGDPPIEVNVFPYAISALTSGIYELSISDANGVADTFHLQVVLADPALFLVNAGMDIEINYGDHVALSGSANVPIASWHWSPPDFLSCTECEDPLVSGLDQAMIYTLTARDEYGCTASDDIAITLLESDDLFVPTIFSPDGDGINDRISVYTRMQGAIKSFRIYDRWGGLMYEAVQFASNADSFGWDGTSHGRDAAPGVYVWVAEMEMAGGQVKRLSGDITLIR